MSFLGIDVGTTGRKAVAFAVTSEPIAHAHREWFQFCADILGLPLRRTRQPEASALGTASMAATAVGEFASINEAAGAVVRLADEFEPHPSRRDAYAPWYERHRALRPLMQEYTRKMARIQS